MNRNSITMIKVSFINYWQTECELSKLFLDIRQQMEKLIADSLTKSQIVHKSIKIFQLGLSEPSSSRTVTRIKNMQLALIKNDYLNVYREHSVFVEKYEEKLKKILKREAQISKFLRSQHQFSTINK